MNKHTPGPWSQSYSNDTGPDDDYFIEFFEIVSPKFEVVARVEHQEDARLIAAAPDLLEALRDALDHVHNQADVGVDEWIACEQKARAAIAKAEGEAK